MPASLVAAALLLLAPAVHAQTCKVAHAGLKAKARITCEQARKTAQARLPQGRIREAELEEEDGKLVYSFDLAVKGEKGVTEIQVDAQSGEVVSQKHEDAQTEAQEKKADAQEKKAERAKGGTKK